MEITSLAESLLEQLESGLNESLRLLTRNYDADSETVELAAEKGVELVKMWESNFSRIPGPFRSKVVEELRIGLTAQTEMYYGVYAQIALSILRVHLTSDELLLLLRECFQRTRTDTSSYAQLLGYVATVMESEDNQLRSAFSSLIIGPDSVIDYFRPSRDVVDGACIRIFVRLLPSHDIGHIQRLYPLIAGTLKTSMETLKRMVEEETSNQPTAVTTQKIITLGLSSIYPISIVRNSFMIMALTPNLINFFFSLMSITEQWFYENYSVLHLNTLALALTFVKTHDYFILSSSWIRVHKLTIDSPSALFLQEQVIVLSKLLANARKLTIPTVDLVIEWLFSLVSALGPDVEALRKRSELTLMRKALLFVNLETRPTTQTRIDNLVDNLRVYDVLTTDECTAAECTKFFESLLACPRFFCLDSWAQMWRRLPPDFFTRLFLQPTSPLSFNRLPHSTEIQADERKMSIESIVFDQNSATSLDEIDRRLCNQRINEYVENQKTSVDELGKQLAEQIGRILQNRNGQTDSTNRDSRFNHEGQFKRLDRGHVELNWLQATSLLSLSEHLHRAELKAIRSRKTLHEGPMTMQTVLEWTNENLFSAFELAYKSGNFEFIVHSTTFRFLNFDQNHAAVEVIPFVCWAVRAMVELKEADAIRGLRTWTVGRFGDQFGWLDAAERLAGGQFESALVTLDMLCGTLDKDRDIVAESVFLLRETALRQCVAEPELCRKLSPRFFSQFLQPVGDSAKFVSKLLNPDVVLSLSSWGSFDSDHSLGLPPDFEFAPAHDLQRAFDRIELTSSLLHKTFSTFGVGSTPDVLLGMDEVERSLANLCRLDPDFTLHSVVRPKVFTQQVILSTMRDLVFGTNTVNIELLCESLNSSTSYSSAVEIGQKLSSWTTRVFGPQSQNSTHLSMMLTRLLRKTGNFVSASQHLQRLLPHSHTRQGTIADVYWDLRNFNEAFKLEYFRNDEKLSAGMEDKLVALANLTSAHLNSWLQANPSDQVVPSAIVDSCLRMAKWVEVIPLNLEVLLNKSAQQQQTFLWPQVVEKLNFYHSIAPGTQFCRLLSGALITVTSTFSSTQPKVHWKLGSWALNQLSDDKTAIDAIRLMPSEMVAIQALCGSISRSLFDRFVLFFGQNDQLNELRLSLLQSPEFTAESNFLSGVNSAAFEELWGAVKRRQKTYFTLAISSFIQSLTKGVEMSPKHAVVACLHLIALLSAHSAYFSDSEDGNSWINSTNPTTWKELLPLLFSRLNHSDFFVRDLFRRLIVHVSKVYPHVVCWSAIALAKSELTSRESDFSPPTENFETFDGLGFGLSAYQPYKQSPVTASVACAEIVDELRKTQNGMIDGVVKFVDRFRSVVLLTMERWLFLLTHLEYEVGRRRRQVENERPQLREVLKSDEKVELLIAQATEVIFLNALKMVKDLYQSTCEGNTETVERQRFARQFREPLRRAIRKAEVKFTNPNPKSFEVFRKVMDRLSSAVRSQQRLKLSNLSPDLASHRWSAVPIPGQSAKWRDEEVVGVQRVKESILVLATKTRPKKMTFIGTDGKEYSFLCKGQEDLHLDERVANFLRICNLLFGASSKTRDYNARCYSVTPLGLRSGLIEWVQGPVSLYTIYRNWKNAKLSQYRAALSERKSEKRAAKFRLLKRSTLIDSNNGDEASGAGADQSIDEEDERELELLQRDEQASQRSLVGDEAEIEFSQNSKELNLSAAMGDLVLRVISPLKDDEDPVIKELNRKLRWLRMSPNDLFASLLGSKFKEENTSTEVMRNRKLWPVELLVDVFGELQAAAPKTLIADELWLKSCSAADWWTRVCRFARSTAVMSVTGFLLGLGDRHLDNVLVDFANGEIVHVDYNVSFLKIAQLRVPERVPFRLTKNIVTALGPTGVEGIFRSSAERTMTVLRSECFSIQTLLTVFVHDPLVEWSSLDKVFPLGTMSIGLSLVVYEDDRRMKSAALVALQIFRIYLEAFKPTMNETREELQSALLGITELFGKMDAYRAEHGAQSELEHYDLQRVEAGGQLKSSIIQHQNFIRVLKPALRLLSMVDQRFYVFMKIYRTTFSEPLVKGHRLLNEPYIDYVRCVEYFQTALVNIENVYIQLLQLNTISELSDFETIELTPTTSVVSDVISLAGSFDESTTRTSSSQTGVEIVESVGQKLAGRDSFINPAFEASEEIRDQSISVVDQVDRLICSATNERNLAQMYEGWTPYI